MLVKYQTPDGWQTGTIVVLLGERVTRKIDGCDAVLVKLSCTGELRWALVGELQTWDLREECREEERQVAS